MNKEIIINDVDVSKCRFYKEGLCCLSYAFVENDYDCVECSEYNDCDYKQLQRKTAECEKEKQTLDEIKLLVTNLIPSCDKCPANKNVRWKPEINQKYWYVDSTGEVNWEHWQSIKRDIYRYYVGNCFRYQCEASEYKELLEAKQALKDLALELNAGREIDWSDDSQNKYQIILDENDNLYPKFLSSTQSVGQVHCLDGHFLDIAKVSIGQEKLIKLIKSGL